MQISNEEHSQLEFPSPTNIQEGFYHCEARNDLGKRIINEIFPCKRDKNIFFLLFSLFSCFVKIKRADTFYYLGNFSKNTF